MKTIGLTTVAVFLAWAVADFMIHGVLLKTSYESTASLWRPMGEMKMGLMYLVTAIAALSFVWIYARMISAKRIGTGLKYGFWFGLSAGVSMGYGTYSVMPIPHSMAFAWFSGTMVEALLGGLIVGRLIKE